MSHELRLALKHSAAQPPRRHLRIAASDGAARNAADIITHRDADEAPMVIRFEGLTREEASRALAAFPGGSRFVLAD